MEQILHVKVPYRKVTLKHYLDPYRDGIRLLPITLEKEKKLTNSYARTYKASGYVDMLLPFDDSVNYSFTAAVGRDGVVDEAKRRKIRHMICKINLDITLSYNDYDLLLKDNAISLYEYCSATLEGYLTNDNVYVDLRNIETVFSTALAIYATETFRQLGSKSSVYSTRIIAKIEE